MKTYRTIEWKRGCMFGGTGALMIVAAAAAWERIGLYPVLGTIMLLGTAAAAVGIGYINGALKQVVVRELLKRNSLRVRADAEFVSKKRRGRSDCWYITVRCVSPVTCEELWITSPPLLEDPKPYLKDGVEVLLDTGYTAWRHMLVENLAKE